MFRIFLVLSLISFGQSKDPDISTSTTWRCGVFIPVPDKKFREPLAKYFVFHRKLEAKCPATFSYKYSRGVFSKKCSKMAQQWERIWSPSRQRLPGKKYGDEVCEIMNKELGMANVPNEAFPEGVKFGFFYNYCGSTKWKDTTVRSKKVVCCQNGKYRNCDALDDETANKINDDDLGIVSLSMGDDDALNNDSSGLVDDNALDNESSGSVDIMVDKLTAASTNEDSTMSDSPTSEINDNDLDNESLVDDMVDRLTAASTNEDSTMSDSSTSEKENARINDIKEKLKSGAKLSDEEEKEAKQFVSSLKTAASQLFLVAKEFEELLKTKNAL